MNHDAILYVEDDVNDVFFMQEAWNRAGLSHQLHTVGNGELAKAYLLGQGEFADRKQHPMPCLILLDLKLPKVSGFELIDWLRRQDAFPMLPVIVISSSNQPQDIQSAYSRGASAYVVKPSDAEKLEDVVSAIKSFWLNLAILPPVNRQIDRQY